MTRRDTLVSITVGIGLFLVYAATAPTGLLGSDQGEFATLAGSPGVAHPPGYPLYIAYLRTFCPLPGISVVHSTAIATAFLGGLTMGVYAAGMRAWGFSAAAAVGATLFVGLDYTVWSAFTHAEALSLGMLLIAAIFWACAPHRSTSARSALLLGVLGGLALSSHHTTVLVAPLGIWTIVRYVRGNAGWKAIPIALFGAALGLGPYLYLLTDTACLDCYSWRVPTDAQELLHHFLRTDYGAGQLSSGGGAVDPFTHWGAFIRALATGSWGIVAISTSVGLWLSWRENRRQLLGTMGGSVALASVLFIGMFNLPTEGMLGDTTARFYLVPIFLMVPFVAAALDTDRVRPSLRNGLIVVASATLLIANAGRITSDYTGVIDAWAVDTLRSLPPNAILLGDGDHRTLAIAYVQHVDGARPDVDYVDGRLMGFEWYSDRVSARLGGQRFSAVTDDGIDAVALTATLLKTGRPVFVIRPFVEEMLRFPSYPYGTVLRLLRPGGRPPPPPFDLAKLNAELFESFELREAPPALRNPWESNLLGFYARPWNTLQRAFEKLGDDEAAQQAEKVASSYRVAP